jgi:hypothetical protein
LQRSLEKVSRRSLSSKSDDMGTAGKGRLDIRPGAQNERRRSWAVQPDEVDRQVGGNPSDEFTGLLSRLLAGSVEIKGIILFRLHPVPTAAISCRTGSSKPAAAGCRNARGFWLIS